MHGWISASQGLQGSQHTKTQYLVLLLKILRGANQLMSCYDQIIFPSWRSTFNDADCQCISVTSSVLTQLFDNNSMLHQIPTSMEFNSADCVAWSLFTNQKIAVNSNLFFYTPLVTSKFFMKIFFKMLCYCFKTYISFQVLARKRSIKIKLHSI